MNFVSLKWPQILSTERWGKIILCMRIWYWPLNIKNLIFGIKQMLTKSNFPTYPFKKFIFHTHALFLYGHMACSKFCQVKNLKSPHDFMGKNLYQINSSISSSKTEVTLTSPNYLPRRLWWLPQRKFFDIHSGSHKVRNSFDDGGSSWHRGKEGHFL